MSFKYLSDADLQTVIQAATDAGLAAPGNLMALTAGVSPAFVGAVMVGGHPLAQLMTLMNALNATRALVSGEVPFEKSLSNAILLAAGRPEEKVFRTALAKISADSVAVPAATADVAAVPRTVQGSLEIEIDQDDTLEVAFLHRGCLASRSVSRVLVHRHFGGVPSFRAGDQPDLSHGTGWLIARTLLITNHHVIAARAPSETPASDQDFAMQGKATTVEFDVYSPAATPVVVAAVECVARDRQLDFAVLRLPAITPARETMRLRSTPLLKPDGSALRERVNVLQHPRGEPMRLGFRNNFVVTASDQRLSYLTDTDGGSSGSPVFDDAWSVAALHRGWSNISGPPVEVWGKQIARENYGTPVARILEHLRLNHLDLHDEIVAAQNALPGL
jgi:endonuclease G, mitochondrial